MAKANYSEQQLRVTDYCDEVRRVLAIHPKRVGWICRPHHTKKHLQIGHRDANKDLDLMAEILTLKQTLETLGQVEALGYTVVIV
jgi:hypothetical protein